MQGYLAQELELALGELWELVENRLTDEDRKQLDKSTSSHIFYELHSFGPTGPVGLGLGRIGGHAIG